MDSRHDDQRSVEDEADSPRTPTETELRALLAESAADVAAGRIVAGDVVLRELQEAAARLEARRGMKRR